MLYVPPEGGQRFNHDRWSSFQAARVFWLPGGSFIIANLKPQRAKEDRNLMGAEAEQSWCRISMGANAAEFQWEPSFVEQKQQACLFSFSVGDIAKEAHVLCKRVPGHAFCARLTDRAILNCFVWVSIEINRNSNGSVNLEEIIILCFEVHLAKGYKWLSYHPFAR